MDVASRAPAVAAPRSPRRARRKPKTLQILGISAAVSLVAWFAWAKTHPADDLAGKLLTAQVTRGDLTETVSATGSVTAQTGAEVKIGSQITGQIKRLYADVGSHVSAGQVIAELNLPDITDQLNQAQANLAGSQTKLLQADLTVGQVRQQTASSIEQAQAGLRSAKARLSEAQAAARQQTAQTPTDIRRAQSALSTAKSTEKQTQASANLQIGTAQEQLKQAQASAANASASYTRQENLYKQGFVAAADVDTAKAQDAVTSSQVQAAQQNLQLVKEKVAADLQAAQDAVTQAQAALVAAQAESYTNAAKIAAVNDAQEQVQQAQATLLAAEANRTNDVLKVQDVQAARDAVGTAKAQVAYEQAQVAKTLIRAPISGTVLQLAAQQGETLAAGLSAPTLIVVADLNRLQVDAYVDETDIGKVRLGQEADVTVDAFPHHVFKGQVIKIASGSTIQQGVVTYDVSIAIKDTRERLKPDMTASVTIHTGVRQNVLLVPSEAVNMGVHGSAVNVLTKQDGKTQVKPVRVRTGGSDGVNTEITSGLNEGQTIVLAGMPSGPQRQGPNPFGRQSGGGAVGGGGRGR